MAEDQRSIVARWRSVRIGGRAWRDLIVEIEKLEEEGIMLHRNAAHRLFRLAPSTEPNERDLNLVKVSVRELGFPEGAKISEIYARAEAIGLCICGVEVAAHLRLQYPDQPQNESLWLAMEPQKDEFGYPVLLLVTRGLTCTIECSCLGPKGELGRDAQLVFCGPS